MPAYNEARRFMGMKDGRIVENLGGGQTQTFSHLTGHLMEVTIKQHEKGKLLELHLIDEQDYFIISTFLNGSYAKGFLMMMKNIDLHAPVTFIPSLKIIEGKKRQSLFISQEKQMLKWYWNRENPGELPPMVQKEATVNGQITKAWDDKDQLAYLELILESDIIPALQKKLNPYPANPVYRPNTGNNIAGNYFGAEHRYGMPGDSGARTHAGNAPVNFANISEPVDDLPF